VAERHASGVLDSCTCIDLGSLEPAALPEIPVTRHAADFDGLDGMVTVVAV